MATPIEPIYLKIGKKIERLREREGLTQEGLGRALGISRAAISSIERGKQRIMAHQLLILSSTLNVSVAELIPSDVEPIEVGGKTLEGELAKKLPNTASIRAIAASVQNYKRRTE